MASKEKVCILGAGGWAIALACALGRNDVPVHLWEIDSEEAARIQRERANERRLSGVRLPDSAVVTDALADALEGAGVVLIVTPSRYVRTTCERIVGAGLVGDRLWACGSKGIERRTLLPMSDVVAQVLPDFDEDRFVAVSGPSHAEEVGRDLPTTLTAASTSAASARRVRDLLMSATLRVYTADDVLGAEIGASLKNVIAIAAGISDGLGFGDNAKAALITRGLSEITRLGVAMGAQPYTFAGLTGMGDLVVTCCSQHSRNWRLGNRLAQGEEAEAAIEAIGMEVEGYYTAASVKELSEKYEVEMPLSDAVYQILYEGKPPKEAVQDLMLRNPKAETEKELYTGSQ